MGVSIMRNWQVDAGPQRYISGRFNRRTFNPKSSRVERETLWRLRQVGRARARQFDYDFGQHHPDHFFCCASNALKCLGGEFRERRENYESERYLDVGCGDSPDALIARAFGYQSVGLDLFSPDYWVKESLPEFFLRSDAADGLPFADHSFDWITCNMMIALLTERERDRFYRNVLRVLKIGGVFVLAGTELKCGYGWRQGTETQRARKIKQWDVESIWVGLRATRAV